MKTGLGGIVVFSGAISLDGLRYRTIGEGNESVDELDDTALDSDGFYESCPDDLHKFDVVTLEVYADLTKVIPVGTVGTITITMAKQDNQTTAATLTGTGYIMSATKLPNHAAGQRLMQRLSIKFDGKTGPTFAAAS